MTTYRAVRDLERRPDTDFFRYFNDFLTYTAGDWTITTTEAGTGSAAEALATNRVGGWLTVTNDDADNDLDFFQLLPAAGHYTFVEGKKLAFAGRFELSEATQSDFHAGLIVTDTDPVGGVVDGIYVRKDDGDTQLDLVVVKDSAATTLANFGTIADDTPFTIEIYYDGGDKIAVYLNGVKAGGVATTNAPDDVQLRPSFGLQNGAAGAKALLVDWIDAWQER